MIKYASPKKAEECAQEIIDFLIKHYMFDGVCIYVNGHRYLDYKTYGAELYKEYKDEDLGETVRVWKENECDPSRYFDYVNKKLHFISMSFEGTFNSVLNFNGWDKESMKHYQNLEEEFCEILRKYGYYYELGNSWNLSCYKIN